MAWGYNGDGQTSVPAAAQSDVIAIAAGDFHSLALKAGGSVVAWGSNGDDQTSVPATAQSGVIAIAAGWHYSLALSVAPEIAVSGNDVPIASGNVTPSLADHTDFDAVVVAGGTQERTFTIANTGATALNLNGTPRVQIGGEHAEEFTVTAQPDTPVAADGGTATFTLSFDPAGPGLRSATVSIPNNDTDENPYTFAIQGTGLVPEIAVSGNGVTIANGDATPDEADHTDFGPVALLNTQITRVFAIHNGGNAPLNLTGTPRVQIGGAHAADFTVTAQPATPLAAGDSETMFAITFDPRLPGPRSATISIASDDPEANAYTFAIAGFGGLSKLYPQAIAFTAPGTIYPGEGPVTLVAEASSGLPVTLSLVSGPATLESHVLTPTGPGKVKVQATQPGGGLYAPAKPVTRTITVKADPATLTLINLSQRYDGTPRPIATLGTAEPVTITYQVGGVLGAAAPTAAGSYNVQAEAGGVVKNGKLIIVKAPLHVTPDDKRKFAGENNPPLTLSYDGFVAGEDESALTTPPTLTTTAKAASPGGLYPITSKGGAAANYTLIHRRGTLVVESFTSGYEALLMDGASLPVGKLSLTVAKNGRSFSGKLFAATETAALSLRGVLESDSPNEQATGEAKAVKNGVTYEIGFTLPLLGEATVMAMRDAAPLGAAADGRRLLAPPKGWKAPYAGAHTAVLEPAAPPAAGVPAGAGWAKATIDTKGALTLAGKLGDGIAFTATLPPDVAADPGYRLFAQPYKPARAGAFLGGTFTLTPHPSLAGRRYLEEAPLTWRKDGLPKDASYRDGFGPAATVLLIDPWQKPAGAETLAARLGLPGGTLTLGHSATGSDSHDDLPANATLSGNQVTAAPSTTKWQTKLNATNGTFTGNFELLDAGQKRKVPFSGILRQPAEGADSMIGDGHFLLPALPGAPSNEKLSGEVLFQRP